MTGDDVREQVRERYAAAATTVMAGGTNNDALLAELTGEATTIGSCCGPASGGDV